MESLQRFLEVQKVYCTLTHTACFAYTCWEKGYVRRYMRDVNIVTLYTKTKLTRSDCRCISLIGLAFWSCDVSAYLMVLETFSLKLYQYFFLRFWSYGLAPQHTYSQTESGHHRISSRFVEKAVWSVLPHILMRPCCSIVIELYLLCRLLICVYLLEVNT